MSYPNDPPPAYPHPPGIAHEISSGFNATEDEALAARQWCDRNPLTPPFGLDIQQLTAIRDQYFTPVASSAFAGSLTLKDPTTRTWHVESPSGCHDTLIQTTLPIYAACHDSPLVTGVPRTVYFEVRILRLGAAPPSEKHHSRMGSLFHRHEPPPEEAGVALGFFAPPYPPYRLPGWQRGSVAVHSDDGRRYVGNTDGGVDFTEPFRVGETVGVGIVFRLQQINGQNGTGADVFFTRDGRKAGDFNLGYGTDAGSENVWGLLGDKDLFPTIGVFGGCEVEIVYGSNGWMHRF
jgi:hypothetical protein